MKNKTDSNFMNFLEISLIFIPALLFILFFRTKRFYEKDSEAFIIYGSLIITILIIIFFKEITYITNLKFVLI